MRVLVALFAVALSAVPTMARFDPFKEATIVDKPGAFIPLKGSVTDETGQETTLTALSAGKPMLIAPVLHNCPNICGVTLSGLMDAVGKQALRPGREFTLVAFGIDPKETVADAAHAQAELSKRFPKLVEAGVHSTVADAETVKAVTGALGYQFAWDPDIGQYAHVAAVAVVSGKGKLTRWLYGVSPDPLDVKLALTEAGQGKTGTWGDQLLLLCYHYDPATGQYTSRVMTALRIGGGGFVLVGLGFLGRAFLRRRQSKEVGNV